MKRLSILLLYCSVVIAIGAGIGVAEDAKKPAAPELPKDQVIQIRELQVQLKDIQLTLQNYQLQIQASQLKFYDLKGQADQVQAQLNSQMEKAANGADKKLWSFNAATLKFEPVPQKPQGK